MSCNTVDQHCSHPANLEGVIYPKSKCMSCSEAVCTNCSIVNKTADEGHLIMPKGRVCGNCISASRNWRLCKLYVKKVHRLAGYTGMSNEVLEAWTRCWYSPFFAVEVVCDQCGGTGKVTVGDLKFKPIAMER